MGFWKKNYKMWKCKTTLKSLPPDKHHRLLNYEKAAAGFGALRWEQESAALLETIEDCGKQCAAQPPKRSLNSVSCWNFLGHHCRRPHPDCGLYGLHWHLAVFSVRPLSCRLTRATIPLDWSNGIGPCWSPGTKRIKLKIVKRTWNTCERKKRDDELSFSTRRGQWGQWQDKQE